jgi:hypothetical protein
VLTFAQQFHKKGTALVPALQKKLSALVQANHLLEQKVKTIQDTSKISS